MKKIDREFVTDNLHYYHLAGDPKYHKANIADPTNDITIDRQEFLTAVKQSVKN